MEWWQVVLALLVPWAAMVLSMRLVWVEPAPGRWPMLLGSGYLFGMIGVAGLLWLQATLAWSWDSVMPLSVVTLLLVIAVFLLVKDSSRNAGTFVLPPGVRFSFWEGLAFGLILLWLVVRWVGLALEVWWQPLFPWDAWTTWGARARVWTELGSLAPFISAGEWLNDPGRKAYTIEAWNYPVTVSLVMTWPNLALGAWNETLAKIPWLGAGLGLGLGFYGSARRWGASPLTALVFTWLLLSLPLLDTHIALAGYADLWLAYALGLAFMAGMLWLRDGDPRQGVLTLALLLACATIKREGLVWALLFIPALLVTQLSRVWWVALVLLALGVGTGLWVSGGMVWDIPTLGQMQLSADLIQLPHIGVIKLSRESPWEPVLRHTFLYSQWHLLPYLIILSVMAASVRIWRGGAAPWFKAGLAWTLTTFAALYVLFFWTEASLWAIQGTSINRVVLHFVPALTFWLMIVWLEWTQPPASQQKR